MVRIRGLLVVALALSTLVVLAAPAGAAVPAANKSFCKDVSKISSSTNTSSASDPTKAKALAKSFKNAAKSAPAKVKSAMNTMADYYQAVGSTWGRTWRKRLKPSRT